jgi:hypothetical protein
MYFRICLMNAIGAPVRVFVQMLNRSALANGGGRPGSSSLHFVPIYWPGTPALLCLSQSPACVRAHGGSLE